MSKARSPKNKRTWRQVGLIAVMVWVNGSQSWAETGIQGARSQGMAGAFAAMENDPGIAMINPAGLGWDLPASLSWSQARLSFDTREYLVLASGKPKSSGSLGAAILFSQRSQDNVQDFRILLDANANPVIDPATNLPQHEILGYYTRYSTQTGLAIGVGLNSNIALGFTAKANLINTGREYAKGWGADLGVLLRTGDLRWAGVLVDLGGLPKAAEEGALSHHPQKLIFGLAWHVFGLAIEKGPEIDLAWWKRPLVLAVQSEARLPWAALPEIRAGVEWLPVKPLAVRVGWGDERLTLGASIRVARVQLDYAAVGGELSQSNRVSVRYDF